MALRIGKKHSSILRDMVLAHRVAVRTHARANSTRDANYFDLLDTKYVTEKALDIALGGDDVQDNLDFIKACSELGNTDAHVALIRLEWLGMLPQ